MTDNEILARWQGWKPHPDGASVCSGKLKIVGGKRPLPDYLNDAAACDSPLDTLVDKWVRPELWHNEKQWQFEIWERDNGVCKSKHENMDSRLNYVAGWLDAEAAIRKEAGKWQT